MQNGHAEFDATGTHWIIDISDKSAKSSVIYTEIRKIIDNFEIIFSRFRQDSFIRKLSRNCGKYLVPSEFKRLLPFYEQLYKISCGKFTPLCGFILESIGYDSAYSFSEKKSPAIIDLKDAYTFRYPEIEIKKKFLFDFGAAGKGLLVDLVTEYLDAKNVRSYIIDAGGDIRYNSFEGNSIKVGLEHPGNKDTVIGVIELSGGSICASSGNRRRWGKYHHIIDPEKMSSPDKIIASYVIADTAMTADGIATALFLEDGEKLKKFFNFEYAVVYSDNSFEKSDGFKAEIF